MKHWRVLAAVCLAAIVAGCDNVVSEPPDLQTMHEARPVGSAKELDVNLKYDVGNLEISRVTDDNLFSFDLQYDRRRNQPTFRFDEGERASLHFDMNGHGPQRATRDNDLTLRLTDKVPLNLDVTTGVSDSQMELTSLQVRRMHLRGGVGKTEVTFEKPLAQPLESVDVESGVGELIIHGLGNTHVEHIDLKGGVGHTELDFTGELGMSRSEATIKVGVGSIRLIIPRDADVDIDGQGGFLSNISAPSFEHHDRTYSHHGGNGAQIHIRVESGIGGVEVELI